MLREFINCRSNEERLAFIKNGNVSDWTEAELNSIMDIVGVKGDYSNASLVDKLNVIKATLSFVKSDKVNFESIDDSDDTISESEKEKLRSARKYTRLMADMYSKMA